MKIPPTLVIVYLRFFIQCNNDFGVIAEIAINENSNYFFVAQKQPPLVAAYKDSLCIERWLFLFAWFYSSFVFANKGVYVIFSEFHTTILRCFIVVLRRLDHKRTTRVAVIPFKKLKLPLQITGNGGGHTISSQRKKHLEFRDAFLCGGYWIRTSGYLTISAV